MKLLDCDYLSLVLGGVRSFKPSEIEAIRKYVQEQLRRKMNPTSEDTAKEYEGMILNDPRGWRYLEAGHDLPEKFGPPYHWIPKPTRGHGSKLPETEFPGGTTPG